MMKDQATVSKTNEGFFFEDYHIGQVIRHAVPRTVGSGERALLICSVTGFRTLDPTDQLTLEFAGSYRHYCACLMRTVAIGTGGDTHRAIFGVTADALTAMTDAARAGKPLGDIDDAHRRVYDAADYGDSRMAACGYSLGASFRPT